jgi:flagellar hook-basal body complex protein FliE
MSDIKITGVLPPPLDKGVQQKPGTGEGFGKLLDEALAKVSRLDREANRSIAEMLEGKVDVQEAMLAMQKVDLSMRLLMTVRNKVIDAYKEIMHMQF